MSAGKLTEGNIILSRWNSQGRLSRTISVGLIFGYFLGLLYGSVMPVSSETCRIFLLLWPGVIIYVVVSFWLAAAVVSNIFVLFSWEWAKRNDAIFVLLPMLITYFLLFWYHSSMNLLFPEAKEEETEK